MNKKLIALAVAAGLTAPMAANADIETKWFGFSQITAEGGDGYDDGTSTGDPGGMRFGTDRVRIGYKLKDDNVFAKLQVDFERTDKGPKTGTLPQIVKDAEVGYKFGNHKLKAGQFKTPIGMDYNTSGKKLDITKRGLEKGLVLERTAGVMLSGRKLGGGFGYDLFFGNPATRSSSVTDGISRVGDGNTTALRLMYDMGNIHLEASTGTSEATGPNEDYSVTSLGGRWKSGPSVVKFEYVAGSDVKGSAGRDETVWYVHGGYTLNRTTELVARYYSAERDDSNRDLTNTYIGANFFLGSSRTNGRLQVNYVLAGGDTTGTNAYNGVRTGIGKEGGYLDDAYLLQYQASF